MVKVEQNSTIKFSAKGELVGITETGISVKDLKEGTIDVINFAEVSKLIGKEVTITIQNKEEV